MQKKAAERFRKVAILTLSAVYFLLLLGGLSRAAGAGMGCPDWPRCFGLSTPPTSKEQLPPDYQLQYANRGYDSFEFNALKTWLEYVNRMVGAGIGVLVIVLVLSAIPYLKHDSTVFFLSLAALGLVGFQGWLGVKVVDLSLMPLVVAVHMIVTLAITAVLLVSLNRTSRKAVAQKGIKMQPFLLILLVAVALLSLVQIVMGVYVREEIDALAASMGEFQRRFWIANLGDNFLFHRLLAFVIVAINGWLFLIIRRTPSVALKRLANQAGVVVLLIIVSGYAMAFFGIPAFLQPFHLLLPAILFALQIQMLLSYHSSTKGRVAAIA